MPRHISLVFPGQGSQHIGMLDAIDSCFVDEVKPIVNAALEFDLIDIINNGSPEDLNRTSITQPALLLASYLSYKQLRASLDFHVNTLCGHSLGEYSALVVGDSLNLEQALKLVHQRGLLMEECEAGSMYAILNCDLNKIINYCEQVQNKLSAVVAPANINSPKQIVIAGDIDAVEEVISLLKNDGIRKCIKLKVSVPSHCKLMTNATNEFKNLVKTIDLRFPKIELIHNFNARPSSDIGELKLNLIKQLTNPVQWIKTMEYLNKKNSIIIECGPNKVLTGIAKSNNLDSVISTSMDDHLEVLKSLL
tara:strand:- start:731 stop:1651 length:921 start_codon:yes stop_codon:yes gene_type:complete